MINKDIAGKKYWDDIYAKTELTETRITSYCEHLLERLLLSIIEKYKPKSILEVGCGNSIWLPYIAEKYDIDIYGIDYSENGCKLVKQRLKKESDRNRIFCINIFDEENRNNIPKVDMLFSLGVIEHFSNADELISIFKGMVNINGIILTEVPNIKRINWIISKIYQPRVLDKHIIHTIESLKEMYNRNEIEIMEADFLGCFTLELFAWGVEPRMRYIDSLIRKIVFYFQSREKHKSGNSVNGPFIYIVGKR